MRVKLISATENPIDLMWTAARTCYSEKSPIDIWDNKYSGAMRFSEKENYNREDCEKVNDYYKKEEGKHWNLVKKVIASQHLSICEHVNFTFVIEGVSRSLLAQFSRHRAGIVLSVQSQRYVEFKESYDTLVQAFDEGTEQQENYLKSIAEKYFINITTENYRDYIQSLINYLGALKRGVKAEDARMILPNATKTNMTVTVNLRELMHIANLRLCSASQLEIRNLLKYIKEEVTLFDERLGNLLQPTCELVGYCSDFRNCGRKPSKEEVFEGYLRYKDLNK